MKNFSWVLNQATAQKQLFKQVFNDSLTVDSGIYAVLVFLDLSADFDTVDQNILLSRLGINGTV